MSTVRYTKRVLKNAYVEVYCGTPHDSIFIRGIGWTCRYAQGMTVHKESGLLIKAHQCHLCSSGCYWLMPALTLKKKRRCPNCDGPAVPSGQPSCWPNLLVLDDFPEEEVAA